LRGTAAAFQNGGVESAAERILRAYNTPGQGRFEIGSLSALASSYVIKSRFTLNDRLKIEPHGH
jgi:hypothetical protein